MKKCVIFCSAECTGLLRPIEETDYVIAADGGLKHTQALNIIPHAVLGDFDSLGYVPENANIFPVEKDDTDAMLAIRHGLSLGYEEFWLYGSLDGPRLDHTIANFQALQYLADRGARGYLIGNDYLVTVVKEEALLFPADATGILSLFCLGQTAENVTLTNLKYPMEKGTITPGFPLGVSNHFAGEQATVRVEKGCLLALWDRKNGIPERKSL